MDKILSVVVPSYNCENFLDKCLGSFINEEVLDRLEVIVVNDGSTDSTQDIAEKYCRKYPGTFRVVSQQNKGHGGALNTGLAIAAGKYVKVVDADDWVETANLAEFVSRLEKCGSDVVLTHHYTRNILTGEVKKWMSYPERFYENYSFAQIMDSWKSFDRSLTFHGITYKTSFYQKNCIRLSEGVFYEDHEYATIPCCFAGSVMPFDMFVYDYRIGDAEQSVSDANRLKRLSHTAEVLNRLRTEYQRLSGDMSPQGKNYYFMKVQGLLLSYITVVMLVEKDKKKGRWLGAEMMKSFRISMPEVYGLALKQYKVFRAMNYLHITKRQWDKILGSKLYNKLRSNHGFD